MNEQLKDFNVLPKEERKQVAVNMRERANEGDEAGLVGIIGEFDDPSLRRIKGLAENEWSRTQHLLSPAGKQLLLAQIEARLRFLAAPSLASAPAAASRAAAPTPTPARTQEAPRAAAPTPTPARTHETPRAAAPTPASTGSSTLWSPRKATVVTTPPPAAPTAREAGRGASIPLPLFAPEGLA